MKEDGVMPFFSIMLSLSQSMLSSIRKTSGFTLIELLIVIAIIAIIGVVVLITLNPVELLKQSRDSTRFSDMDTLSHALTLYIVDKGMLGLGSPSAVYVSLPDLSATTTAGSNCAGLSLAALPNGWTYHCAASSTYRKTDGTGWLPVNFEAMALRSPLSNLPTDPVNASSANLFYTYIPSGSKWELTAAVESGKYGPGGSRDRTTGDGGLYPDLFEAGTITTLAPIDFASATSTGSASSSGNGLSYAHSRMITIDHTKVPNTDQANFPVLIAGSYGYLATVPNGGSVSNSAGYDIIFASDASGTNKLSFEQEKYVPSTGEVAYWVKVPTLSHSVDTPIYLLYGSSSVFADPSNPTAVWDTNYKGVWHLGNGTTLSANDSTGNGINGIIANVTPTVGKIDGGGSFNGTNTSINLGDQPVHNVTNVTVSAWVNAISYPNIINTIIGKVTGGPPYFGYELRVENGYLDFNVAPGGTPAAASTPQPLTGGFHYVVGSYDGTTIRIYVDGTQANSTVVSGATSIVSGNLYIGETNVFFGRIWNGVIDDVRISAIARSPDWIRTEYNNQSNPSGFYNVGVPSP